MNGMGLKLLAATAVSVIAVAATPASAVVQVYTNQALFVSQRPGITTNSFSFEPTKNPQGASLGLSYTNAGVTFATAPLRIKAYNDGAYGANTSYISLNQSDIPNTLATISFAGPVLGLVLGSYDGPRTVSYIVNGQVGSIALAANRATSFLGFDTGTVGPISVTFNTISELDIIGFNTAVPEPATWGMMMLGVGMIGGMMRYRRRVGTTKVAYA